VISLGLSVEVLGNARFGFSPLAELVGSAITLCRSATAGREHPHARWTAWASERVSTADLPLLLAAMPEGRWLADFLAPQVDGPEVDVDDQLDALAAVAPDDAWSELTQVWGERGVPTLARAEVEAGTFGRHLADELARYWALALAPHWPRVRAALEADVAFRAGQTLRGGLFDLLGDIHHQVSVEGDVLRIDKPHHVDETYTRSRLTLVPSAFLWPMLVVAYTSPGCFQLTYPARGVGRLWEGVQDDLREPGARDELAHLLGRTRAAVLTSLGSPRSTTHLARELGQSPATVSQHLAVLRDCGMVRSWRSGRSVLYVQTALATSLVGASRGAGDRTGS
jgi:biotin operon repressor